MGFPDFIWDDSKATNVAKSEGHRGDAEWDELALSGDAHAANSGAANANTDRLPTIHFGTYLFQFLRSESASWPTVLKGLLRGIYFLVTTLTIVRSAKSTRNQQK